MLDRSSFNHTVHIYFKQEEKNRFLIYPHEDKMQVIRSGLHGNIINTAVIQAKVGTTHTVIVS